MQSIALPSESLQLPVRAYYRTGDLAAAAHRNPATVRYHLRVMVAQRLLLIKRRSVEDGHVRLDRAQALKVLEFMEGRKRRIKGSLKMV